ncbi:ISKra4 family transposase [Nocardia sp. NPDC059246]|uniref:ISKra4 family transposase n=1 Tax=unclassified Nocardia TaxID=2637762 RepID=UPI0036A13CD6
MTPYDAGASAGPFDLSATLFDSLVAELGGETTATATHAQLEDLLTDRSRELMRQLLQDHLDLRAAREETGVAARMRRGEHPAGRTRVEYGHHRMLATVFGPVTVRRTALRAPDEPNIYPADAVLSLPRTRHSHGLRRRAVEEAVRSSYDITHAVITARCGRVAGKRQLEDLVVAAAVDIDDFYATATPEPATGETLLVLSADAKGIVMRPDSLREPTRRAAARATPVFRTRLGPGEKSNRKRMATLACVYDAQPAPRRPHDVITVPGGPRAAGRDRRPGPVATGKWLTGSVTDSPERVIAAAFDQAQARDPAHARTWVALIDGAWHQIEVIETEARRRGVTIDILVDLIHVTEYCWGAARSFYAPTDPAAEDWVAVAVLGLLAGRVEAVATSIETRAETEGLTPDARRGADDAVRYLRSHAAYLHYERALAEGWPIATGVIEGACRHIIADRFEKGGARWGLAGAEALLTLRALTQNGDLDRYWTFHIAREHQRVHPDDHQLAA